MRCKKPEGITDSGTGDLKQMLHNWRWRLLIQSEGDSILTQLERPIIHVRHWLWWLDKVERAHDAMHRDSPAVIWTTLLLRSYLDGAQFTVRTDHNGLGWISCMVAMPIRVGFRSYPLCWSLASGGDAISCIPMTNAEKFQIKYYVPLLIITEVQHEGENFKSNSKNQCSQHL